jgi:hypothetical protein
MVKILMSVRVTQISGDRIWSQDLVPGSGEEGGNNTEESLLNRQGCGILAPREQ